MKLLSWNLNGRTKCLAAQVAAIAARCPDVVALQEVTTHTVGALTRILAEAGLCHAIDSFSLADPPFLPRGPRRYGQVIASRYPLEPMRPDRFAVPWPERVLSVRLMSSSTPLEIHTVHIPLGSSNAWITVEMLEGLYAGLAIPSVTPRILCGDFNTPQDELPGGQLVTWAQRRRPDGTIVVRKAIRGGSGLRWDAAERSVLSDLAAHDLIDVFRLLHGYERRAFSWVLRRGVTTIPRRFDHIFASLALDPVVCEYVDAAREQGLSDHAMIEAVFASVPHL